MRASELSLQTPLGRIAGLRWSAEGPRVLAVHGWLDNAASFVPLANLMRGFDIAAIDLPGHGHSDHRPAGNIYSIATYLFEIDAALDALGWEACHLLGHSMGGAVTSLYASAAPERVLSLTLLDGLGPLTEAEENTATRLQRSLRHRRKPSPRRKRYDSIDAMAEARMANADDLQAAAAQLICQRAAREVEGGFEWRFDPALYGVTPVMMTEQQVLDCLRAISVPTLTINALPRARWIREEQAQARSAAVAHGKHIELPGGHHFRMDQADTVAGIIEPFLRENDRKPSSPVVDSNKTSGQASGHTADENPA